jgi:hypothetical protein
MLRNILIKLSAFQVNTFFYRTGLTRTQLEKLHAPESQFGIISPYRNQYSSNQNKRRLTQLIQDVQALGLTWESVQGIWKEKDAPAFEKEVSLLVYDITFDYLCYLGTIYEQESVIFKPVDGPVGLYNISEGQAQLVEDYQLTMNSPKPKHTPQKEEITPYTRMRDTELSYDISPEKLDFGKRPIIPPAPVERVE